MYKRQVVSVSAEEKYDLTLYSVNTTDPDFDDWLANVEEATGLNINVIAAPTDTDTRQQKITTILSTGDSSVDIVEINDEMSAAFKNSGWLEGLNDTVMTDDIIDQFAQGYIQDMITDKDGNIIDVKVSYNEGYAEQMLRYSKEFANLPYRNE